MRRSLFALALGLACQAEPPRPLAAGPLPEGVAVRVGGTEIGADVVLRVARAQRTTAAAAAAALADDALAAEAARARGIDLRPDAAWPLRAHAARLVTDRLREEAKAAGPPTDAEIAEITREHWQDVDSPERRTVIHAVVLKPAAAAAARAVASAVAAAVADARDEADFERRAGAVPAAGLQVKVERLPAFVADGRVAEPGAQGGFDATFAAAAFAIPAPGGTSPVFETSFGWHVVRLVKVAPPRVVPLDQRRALFGPEAIARRARARHDALLAELRAKVAVDVSLSAEAAMRAVKP